MRGIDYVQIPTTLLSQIDSSVGGKTAINSKYGKNLIGSFYQPKLVIIDTKTLKENILTTCNDVKEKVNYKSNEINKTLEDTL